MSTSDEDVQRWSGGQVTLAEYANDIPAPSGENLRDLIGAAGFYPGDVAEMEAFVQQLLRDNPALATVLPRERISVEEPSRAASPRSTAEKLKLFAYLLILIGIIAFVIISGIRASRRPAARASQPSPAENNSPALR